MAKQLNVSLGFTANTSEAKRQLQDLQKQLSSLTVSSNSKTGMTMFTKEIKDAQNAVVELQSKLKSATNVDTGKLDLSKFSRSLGKNTEEATKKLKQYQATLSSLGPEGDKAFLSLASSIQKAEVPLRTSNKLLKEFKTTLMNTARWQFSSSMLHGFVGAMQSAYGYAQDLNESLNNIRIVTGYSTEEMAKFAKEANKAARQLSTNTTTYTDAALIYYQQGLSDKQVKERTDVTIKMANVARESATDVSSYMTAIWNNFDKTGTQSMEHFADVITALGAATAASTQEIAHGLEKFAAVADTIGLSYDYATSAIATIVDKTRQSEDVVGTALKTIFARIQGLNLGETLEDGTTLNKYSKALESVGISIFDSVGNLKDMDTILDEMGSKWKLLSDDQQVALAQTVAGVRQYNQLVALMDNYDAFKGNIDIAKNSNGALQQQADIYAESWEAAKDRVDAALESIFNKLLKDDFFIDMLNAIEKIIGFVDKLIDGFGGLRGVILLVGSALTKAFSSEMASEINRISENMRIRSGKAKEDATRFKGGVSSIVSSMAVETDTSGGYALQASAEGQNELQQELIRNADRLSETRKEELQNLLDINEAIGQAVIKTGEQADEAERLLDLEKKRVARDLRRQGVNNTNDKVYGLTSSMSSVGRAQQGAKGLEETLKKSSKISFKAIVDQIDRVEDEAKNFKHHLDSDSITDLDNAFNELKNKLQSMGQTADGMLDGSKEDINEILMKLSTINNLTENAGDSIFSTISGNKQQKKELEDLANQAYETGVQQEYAYQSTERYKNSVQATKEEINKTGIEFEDFGEKMTAAADIAMTTALVFSTLDGIIDTLMDKDISGWDKLQTVLGSLLSISPMVISTLIALKTHFAGLWTAITGPIGIAIALVSSAVVGIVALFQWQSKAGERAAKKAQEAVGAYNETLSELQSLQDELDTTQSKLRELYAMAERGSLSITDQKELIKLESQNAQLEAQIKLKQQLLAMEQRAVATSAKEAYSEDSYNIDSVSGIVNAAYVGSGAKYNNYEYYLPEGIPDITEISNMDEESFALWTSAMQDLIAQAKADASVAGGDDWNPFTPNDKHWLENAANTLQNQLDNYTERWEEANLAATQQLQESYSAAMDYLPSLYAQNNEILYGETIDYYENIVAEWYRISGTLEETALSAFNAAGVSIEDLNEIVSGSKGFEDLTSFQQETFTTFANSLGLDVNTMIAALQEWDGEIVYNTELVEEAAENIAQSNLEIYEMAKKLKEGDSISAEDYAKLDSVQQTYFSLMLDGTYKLTSDAEDFYNLVHSQMISERHGEMASLSAQNETLSTIAGYDFSTLSSTAYNSETGKYNSGTVEQQLQLLETLGGATPEQLEAWKADSEDSNMVIQNLTDIANAVSTCETAFNGLGAQIDANNTRISELDLAIALSYENFDDLRDAYDEGTISAQAFTQAQQELLETERMEGLDAEEVRDYAEYLEDTIPELEGNEEGAENLAIQIKRMNTGIDTLANNWEDWNGILQESSEGSEEYCTALSNMKGAMSDLLDISEDFISTDMILENMEDIEKAANGDADAIDRLRTAALEEIIVKISLDENSDLTQEELTAKVQSLQDQINELFPDGITLGTSIDDSGFIDACNEMILAAGMSADEVNALFSGMGYDVSFASEPQQVTTVIPHYITHHEIQNMSEDGRTYDEVTWTEENGSHTVEGETTAFAMQTSEPGTTVVPQINSVSKKASGSSNNYSSSNNGGTKSPGGSSKSGGKEKKKDVKKLSDEIDRYHEIKELLEDIQTELDRINKKKDRAWGGGKLAAIKAETEALKSQIGALREYQSQIQANLSKDKGALGQYGWSLDGNGNVSNYESNMARLVNQWNNSAQEQADKDYFENAKKALQQYEESKDLYDDVIDQITDATYALADAELEAIEYSVEIHLELDDNKLKLLEDIMETIGDSAARAVDNIEMIEKSIDTVLHQMETSKDGMKSIFDYIGLSGDVADRIMNGTSSEGDQKSLAEILNSYGGAIDMDRVVQDLQQYQDNLLSYNEALRNYRDQVFETVNNAFTEHLEDFDRANDKIAHCVNLVSGYKDLIEAIGRKNIDVHGELTQKLNQALEAQAEDAHRAALAKEKYAQSAYQEALEGYQTAIETGDEYAINKWTEILETAQDELQAAKEDSQAALTEWANAIAESFSSAIQQVIDDLDTALGGLKLLREDFDMAQEIDAQYLDDYEKIYQLSKLTREVQASMDETDNVAAKKALMEYQSKINAYQQQGVQMSQYELDYLRAQYELELARIALEESKNAKSQVSMVKDAEGNYSYVYTADDEAVAEAEQTYEDKLYEMQRLNGDYINELQSNIITMQEEMSAKLEEIANNDLLSYEDKMLRMDEVRNYYLERIRFYDSQLGISIENNKELYDNEWTEYSAKTGYKISANEDYVDNWEETTLAILTNVETQEDYFDQLEQAINHATEEAENCCERAQDALNEAGMTTEELGQTISQTTDELIRDADDAANSAEQMSDEYQRAMQEIMNAATTFTSAYASMISSTIAQNQSLIASMQSVIQMALQMKAALAGASSSGGIGGGSGGGSGGSGGGGNSGQASSLAQSALTLLNEVHHGKYGTNGWIPGAKSAGYDQRVISLVLQALNDSKAGGGYDYFYDKAKQLLGFNTGGYTGNWGTSQGRLALLHQKELVLNAQDTPNILDAVGIVRDIAKAIDINALSAMVNGGLTAATFSNGKEEVLEQNVHITAEFPNATDKHEILEAFDNVINLAAQYANRKN